MYRTLRSITGMGTLALGSLLGVGTAPVQAQDYTAPAPRYADPAYTYPAYTNPTYPTYTYPAYSAPAPANSRPGEGYVYDDRGGALRGPRFENYTGSGQGILDRLEWLGP